MGPAIYSCRILATALCQFIANIYVIFLHSNIPLIQRWPGGRKTKRLQELALTLVAQRIESYNAPLRWGCVVDTVCDSRGTLLSEDLCKVTVR
jgi:hypothetical protein